ncbi:MAG: Holliday junction resolvase RuvX [Hyphomonadaceae bacterium]|nr:Holliday junction resolvase RuvX [Hyphomonadaceae bacterium]
MPLLDLAAFAAALPAQGALFGLDPGSKRIGVAASDATRLIASGLEILPRTRFAADADRLLALYDARGGVGWVIGLPLNMDGSAGPSAQAARAFAANLLKRRDAPVMMWDERLSTAAVTRTLIDADATRARRAQVVDKLAAAYMLQGALDALQARR